ncbi:MAG: hypothetical protein CO119_08125 [Flavobacteriales bacterium CG_4_9_14_3_um_filter_40_17]|nr:MAG: hypothetical protein CO119_08125 [Flavobacteriales bacterium CG_4_9_14_3_um_filter_40_17]
MKNFLKILFFVVLIGITYGLYLIQNEDAKGDKIVGVSVLMLCFVLMPLFIYHRYKGKDLSRYQFKNHEGNSKSTDNQ